MKHYFNPMSRAITTDWMLKEMDVPHERIVVDFKAGDNNTPEYRAINPMGKVPALVDGDVIVTEAAAICAYLADKFPERGFAPPAGSPARGRYYRYLFFSNATLEPAFTVAQSGLKDYNAASAGWGDIARCMAAVESMTPANDWALGERFTAADVVFGGTLDFLIQFGMMRDPSPKMRAYVARIKARPVYRATHDSAWH